MVAIPSVGLLAEHTEPDEHGRAYAAHFALTHLFWLFTYPAAGYLAKAVGTPRTFTAAGAVCALLTLVAMTVRREHRARGERVSNSA
jgi:MFS transporter, NRE family, putaive nickel resistance protein